MKISAFVLIGALLIGSLTACHRAPDTETDAVLPSATAPSGVKKLDDFGDRAFLVNAQFHQFTVYNQGMLEIQDGMLYFTAMEASRKVVMCQDLSCRHVHSRMDLGIPITCQAETPHGAGIPIRFGEYIYVISNGWEEESGIMGLFVSRRSVNNGGWKDLVFIPEIEVADSGVVGFQVMENGKMYLAARKTVYYDTELGDLCNSCFGLMELDLTSGSHRMAYPIQEDLYQNVYYLNKVGRELIYSYVSAPLELLSDFKGDLDAVGKMLLQKAVTRVVYVNGDTMEVTGCEEYTSDKSNEKGYFVDCNGQGITYVKDHKAYWKAHHSEAPIALFDVEKSDMLVTQEYQDGLRIFVNSSKETKAVYDVRKDGTIVPVKESLDILDRGYCFENGYSLVMLAQDTISRYRLVSDDVWKTKVLPEKMYLTIVP